MRRCTSDHGGRVVMLGLPAAPIDIDWAAVVIHMITIKGIYGREMFETCHTMNAMLRTGLHIATVITDQFRAVRWPTPSPPRDPDAGARSFWIGLSWTELG